MPTIITNSIGPGKTYATIQAWMTAAGTAYPSGLTTADVIWKGELYPSSSGNEWTFTSSNTFPSIATDANRYFLLTAAPTYSFADNANKLTNALTYNSANGVSLSFSGNYTTLFSGNTQYFQIQNLQIKRTLGSGVVSNTFSGGVATYSNCIFYAAGSNSGGVYKNCLFVGSSISSVGFPSFVYNCTFANFNTGTIFTTNNYSQVTIKNCAIFGYTAIIDNVSKIVAANSTYNATNLSSFGWSATGNIVNKTYANQFQNITSGTEDFRVKAGADLINAGIRDQTNTNDLDIVGTTRLQTTPTIGAWEFPSITYTYARPTSDITTQWSTSSGTTHYTLIDETVADDNDYIVATAAGQTDEVKLASMTPPQVGTNLVINYKVTGVDGGATVTVSLRQGSAGTLIKTDTAKSANGTYALTVAPADWAAVTDWSDLRLRFVSA